MKQHAPWFVIAMSLIAVAPAWAQSPEGQTSDHAAGVLYQNGETLFGMKTNTVRVKAERRG